MRTAWQGEARKSEGTVLPWGVLAGGSGLRWSEDNKRGAEAPRYFCFRTLSSSHPALRGKGKGTSLMDAINSSLCEA